jgi:hypothetical protein
MSKKKIFNELTDEMRTPRLCEILICELVLSTQDAVTIWLAVGSSLLPQIHARQETCQWWFSKQPPTSARSEQEVSRPQR